MSQLTLLIPANKESESLPIFLKELSDYKFSKLIVLQEEDKETKARIYKRSSLNQPTSLDSVAETILFMLSDSSHSMTGQNVIVDSGTI